MLFSFEDSPVYQELWCVWQQQQLQQGGIFLELNAPACNGTLGAGGVTFDVNGTRWLLSWGISMHRHPLPSLCPCLEAGDTSLQAHVPSATTLGRAQAPQGHPAGEYSQIHSVPTPGQ